MSNKFYTIMIVPEKTSQVRRIVVPTWIVRGAAVGFAFVSLLGAVMLLDYWYVMNQIGENKQLKVENRRLRQQVQVFHNKMATIEATMERVKTFATRLKVITNIEDRGSLLQTLNSKLPDSSSNIGKPWAPQPPASTADTAQVKPAALPLQPSAAGNGAGSGSGSANGSSAGAAIDAAPAHAQAQAPQDPSQDPEELALQREYRLLDERFTDMNQETLYVEQLLQDQYELLSDQKAFLAALPTRRPAIGYFTSGFGVRKSPYGGRVKMHEGLDIANRPGTPIKAPADGTVEFADSKSGYGQTLILDHGYGLETVYGHTRKLLVHKGDKVHRGQTIALLGNSGRSTGPHVHYEVRVHGTPVDPLSYILEN